MKGANLKLTKSNVSRLIQLGKATRFGLDWPGNRCLARTRSGSPCQKPALKGKRRCQLHGGKTPSKPKLSAERNHYQKEIAEIGKWAKLNGYSFD